ncbi:6-hydroxymethylpterin diphosphokinase MptE-like protein [Bacillus sp. JJ1122]|uniref:motility associated factor glycosyltransferase family protein n=1 Tax=Bacillus sp. JJ1122 TaxID=3122951 RepID=UPI003000C095
MDFQQEFNQSFDIVNCKIPNQQTLRVNGFFLHSQYDPIKEAKKNVDRNYKRNHLHILIGIGAGYIADELLSKFFESDHLLIIEPNIEIVNAMINKGCYKKAFNNKQVSLLIGENISNIDVITSNLIREYVGRMIIIESPNFNKVYPDTFNYVVGKIKDMSNTEIINLNTTIQFAEIWQENFLINIKQALNSIPIRSLHNKLTCPAIIVSGGPSLTKQLPVLKEIIEKDLALVICAGSTINSLLKYDIKPHIIVSIDGGEGNAFHFKDMDISDIPLFYSLNVHPLIPRNHKGLKIVFKTEGDGLDSWVSNNLMDIGVVKGGATVSNFSLDIARKLTSGSICVIGQDLAYTNNETHAAGNKNLTSNELQETLKSREMIPIKGYYGEEVFTDYSLLTMKYNFEQYIRYVVEDFDNRKFFNATEGGAYIEEFENITFKEFRQSFANKSYHQELNSLFENASLIKETISLKDFKKGIQAEITKLSKIEDICISGLKRLRKVKKSDYEFSSNDINFLNEIDLKLQKLLQDNFMVYMFEFVLIKFNKNYNNTDRNSKENKLIFDKSTYLYENILKVLIKSKPWLNELFDQVK